MAERRQKRREERSGDSQEVRKINKIIKEMRRDIRKYRNDETIESNRSMVSRRNIGKREIFKGISETETAMYNK